MFSSWLRQSGCIIFCAAVFFPAFARAQSLEDTLQKSRELKLATRVEWLRLGHYQRTLFGSFKSQADGEKFFLAPNGKSDPHAELEATITKFYQTDARCRFPARWRWLSHELNVKEASLPKSDCTKLNDWRQKISAKSVTLVFSSYYLNNPSSTFGHSFMRLNKTDGADGAERAQLLDYGINYAATATTENPILYAFYGLSGVFPGEFTSLHYYYKVREYNDAESRDLWEYDLNLTPLEVEMLVDHLWEVGSTYFDYYYLTENCSYHMLTVLEAAAPRLNLTSHLPYWAIPADTIKTLKYEPGLVKAIHYRPSVRTLFFTRADQLQSPSELQVLTEMIESQKLSPRYAQLTTDAKIRTLDTAVDYIDYKYVRKLYQKDPDYIGWKQRFLVARSKLGAVPELKLAAPEKETPHDSHGSTRIGAGAFFDQNLDRSYELSARMALHDLADPSKGYPPYAKIEFVDLRWRYKDTPEDREIKLNTLTLFSVDSLSAWNYFEKPVSWRGRLGMDRLPKGDPRCNDCLATTGEVGGGISWAWLNQPLVTQYFLILTTVHTSPLFPGNKWSLSLGPLTGIRFGVSDNFIIHGEAGWRTVLHSSPHDQTFAKTIARWSPDLIWALNLSSEWTKYGHELGAGVYWYW